MIDHPSKMAHPEKPPFGKTTDLVRMHLFLQLFLVEQEYPRRPIDKVLHGVEAYSL